ncbi:exonuclease 1 isoform X2 [Engraulis encrasicolus]|uniref:exonuclease 1 isoform X2 n=1 Tax=Engraulis encrasicolus TaxID=184585 RepID=UPI002FD12243
MGIQGLLQFIKDASEPIHVKKYKGQTVAVDTYCWLHKGAFACAEKLAKGEPTDQYVTYCMKFVDMLLSFGVKPILVFDGCNLPSKQEVEKARRERRQANLLRGKQLLREGKLSEARECFTRCVNVTHSMAHEVIKAARTRGVDCVVAPYEADAQLAFLNKAGVAQAIITEDSDLLAFGCKKVILKMDKQGHGLEIDQNHLGRCRLLGNIFTEEKFRHMCILSGCDYLASLYGIGLGKACKLLRTASNPDILKVIKKMGQYLKMNLTVPEEYLEGFTKAENTFLYQLVFDPMSRKVVPLNPYPADIDPATLTYAGVNVGDKKGLQMALGNVDIHTMEKIDDFNPDHAHLQTAKPRSRSWNDGQESKSLPQGSIWARSYVPGITNAPNVTPAAREKLSPTKGKERVVSVKGLKLSHKEPQVKRPRQESSISEDDLMHQYGTSDQKRPRVQSSPVTTATSPESRVSKENQASPSAARPRNRFATLLQKRNQGAGAEEREGTLSRFFHSNSSSSTALERLSSPSSPSSPSENTTTSRPAASHNDNPSAVKTEVGEEPLVCEESCSPPSSPPPLPSRPASQGLGVFSWSGSSSSTSSSSSFSSSSSSIRRPSTPATSGLAALQQFQRKKEGLSWGGSTAQSSRAQQRRRSACVSDDEEEEEQKEKKEEVKEEEKEEVADWCVRERSSPDSPPSQDSAYFSQPNSTFGSLEETPTSTYTSLLDVATPEKTDSPLSQEESPTDACSPEEGRSTPVRPKVAGLPRVRPSEVAKGGKIRTSAPARASGLRKKPAAGPGGRRPANDENQPGVQATISGLWKSFGFKREATKIAPCKKGEPMSPVEDNVVTSC